MQYIIFILLGLFIVHLVIRLRKKEMQLLELQTKLYQMQTETEQAVRTAEEATAIKDEIRDHITVLYRQLGKNIAAEQLATQSTNQSDESAAGETEQKIKAPDFTVYDADGNEVHLADYIGKPIVLNFWASWCGPCQSEMPDFHEKYLELGDDVHFLMINMTDGARETVESASAFIAKNGYAFPVFYDTKSDAASIYGAYSLPTTFFIDADGYAIAQATGAIDAETLQRGLDMIK